MVRRRTAVNNSKPYRVKLELTRAIISRHPTDNKNITKAAEKTLWSARKLVRVASGHPSHTRHTGCTRHRTACARMAWAVRETNSIRSPWPGLAVLSSSRLRLDVESICHLSEVVPRIMRVWHRLPTGFASGKPRSLNLRGSRAQW